LRAGLAIVDVARRDCDLFDQRGFRVGSDMRLEAQDSSAAAMLGPGGFAVASSAEKPQNRRPVIQDFGKLDGGQVVPEQAP
jgi:hypothetical protein